ncbi:MAG: hypothetical protein RLZZ502_795 [Pseudomonadota bacterium]
MNLLTPPFAFVDIETTGSNATRDAVTEVAVIRYDGEHTERWVSLVNPQVPIPPFITALTGIHDDMVCTAPSFAEIAKDLAAMLAGHVFVAHNARFDYGFLKNEFKRVGIDFRAPVMCTVKLSRALYPLEKKHNLDSIVARHQINMDGRHRALADTEAIYQFWRHCTQNINAELLQLQVKNQLHHPSLPAHLDAAEVENMPQTHGVYRFYGENHILLYVGKANNLKKRVYSHFASDHQYAKEMAISQQVRRIEWDECAGEVEALLTEARQIKELQPTLNRQLRRDQALVSWRLRTTPNGWLIPDLVSGRELDLGAQHALYGLFSGGTRARAALYDLCKDSRLCARVLDLEKDKVNSRKKIAEVETGAPCFARQLRKCNGACVGEESMLQHNIRLMQVLHTLKLRHWPFAGPATLAEGAVWHVIDRWCYLGTAQNEAQLAEVLSEAKAVFDRDSYKILSRHLHKMQPIGLLGH